MVTGNESSTLAQSSLKNCNSFSLFKIIPKHLSLGHKFLFIFILFGLFVCGVVLDDCPAASPLELQSMNLRLNFLLQDFLVEIIVS